MTDSVKPANQKETQPASSDIRTQLERILTSPGFSLSERLSDFLRFIVEAMLEGHQDRLKEFTIAVEVYAKDESFDPRLDAIVRVEAGRLRAKLREYFDTHGQHDPIVIEIPKGSYAPIFRFHSRDPVKAESQKKYDTEQTRHTHTFRNKYAFLILLILTIAAGVSYFSSDKRDSLQPDKTKIITSEYSIAVLPLRNLSGDLAHYYFSDGMTDALITSLAKNSGMKVISMTSVMRYRDTEKSIIEIAKELNVAHIIEGSVLFDGERVRITIQLIKGETDIHLWAQSYERDISNVITVQDEIANQVARTLTGQIIQQVTQSNRTVINPDAHEFYLKARYFKNQITEKGFEKGIEYFQKTIDIEPGYAPAYAGMASCYCLLAGHGFELVKPTEGMPVAKAAVLKALNLDDSLAEAHAFLGIIKLKYDWDWSGAERSFRRAIELNPSLYQGHFFYSIYLESIGQQEEAITQAQQARELDPLSMGSNFNLGWQLYQAGKLDKAVEQFNNMREINPQYWGSHWGLGHVYQAKGLYEQAIAAFQQAVTSNGGHVLPLTSLGYANAISGNHDKALQIIDELKTISMDTYVSPFNIATIYAGLNEKEKVLEWLEKAYKVRSRSLAWLKVNKDFDDFHDDPGFNELLQRISSR